MKLPAPSVKTAVNWGGLARGVGNFAKANPTAAGAIAGGAINAGIGVAKGQNMGQIARRGVVGAGLGAGVGYGAGRMMGPGGAAIPMPSGQKQLAGPGVAQPHKPPSNGWDSATTTPPVEKVHRNAADEAGARWAPASEREVKAEYRGIWPDEETKSAHVSLAASLGAIFSGLSNQEPALAALRQADPDAYDALLGATVSTAVNAVAPDAGGGSAAMQGPGWNL
jgi:hypothetical protein